MRTRAESYLLHKGKLMPELGLGVDTGVEAGEGKPGEFPPPLLRYHGLIPDAERGTEAAPRD